MGKFIYGREIMKQTINLLLKLVLFFVLGVVTFNAVMPPSMIWLDVAVCRAIVGVVIMGLSIVLFI